MVNELRDPEVKEMLGKNIVIDGSEYRIVDVFPGFFQDPDLFCQQAFRPIMSDPFPQYKEVTAILWDTSHKIACSYHKKAGDVPALYFDESDVRTDDVRTDKNKEKENLYSIGYDLHGQSFFVQAGFMSERDAAAAAVSLFSKVQRRGGTTWYHFFFGPIHIFSSEGWTELQGVRTEAVPSEIIES